MCGNESDRGSMDKMLNVVFLILVGIHSTEAVTHSMKYFYTGSSQVPNFPEFVVVGYVDDVEMVYYDNNTQKAEPKQDWVSKITDPQYWEGEKQIYRRYQESFKTNAEIAKKRFNHTRGVHIFQQMYGCEWDDETQQVTGYLQLGYDGEDFLTWNMESNRWVAPQQQAVLTINKWNNDREDLEYIKFYLNLQCPEWLKKYVDYGRSSLMRTVRPSVSLLQKSSSSPVSCFATGFYPNRAEMFWRKNGEEIHGVEKGEILPNNDGTFQMTADIDLSSVPTGDWNKYECVFQLSGVDDITNRLEKTRILTNESNANIVLIAIAVLGVIGGFVVIGLIIYMKKHVSAEKKTSTLSSATSSSSSETSSLTSKGSDDSKGSSSSDKPLLQRKQNPNK